MIPGNVGVSSTQFWISGIVAAFLDVVLVLLLTWRIKPSRFRDLKWTLVVVSAAFWSIFGILLVSAFWDSYYRYFFPGWFRSGGILLFVPVLYAAFALAFHWVAFRLPGNPIVIFCLLSGLESLLEHLLGIYGLKILEVPILQAASPASILTFSFPEYIFYWCIVIAIALLFQNGRRWWLNRQRAGAKTG